MKSRLAFDQQRGPVWKTIDLTLKEDVLSGDERAPSEFDSRDRLPQDYKLKIDMPEV